MGKIVKVSNDEIVPNTRHRDVSCFQKQKEKKSDVLHAGKTNAHHVAQRRIPVFKYLKFNISAAKKNGWCINRDSASSRVNTKTHSPS